MHQTLAALPPRSIFPPQMPRYPNLWFLIHPALLPRPEYPYAIRLLVRLTETHLGLRDTFLLDVENPNVRELLGRPGEGADWQARIGPLQPYQDPELPARSHSHQLHARFYVGPLAARPELGMVPAPAVERGVKHFAIAASVHYEVATEEPLHPYVDSCPLCGITGSYAVAIDPASQDYCLKIHDPLGLEFLLHGRIRGQAVTGAHGRPVPAVEDLERLSDAAVAIHEAVEPRLSPSPLAVVTLGPR